MSKDDLLFKNVMKIFGFVIGLGVAVPLVYFVVPGLVTSLLMLGGIIGFFWAVAKFASVAGTQSTDSRADLLESNYTGYRSGNIYGPGSYIKGKTLD